MFLIALYYSNAFNGKDYYNNKVIIYSLDGTAKQVCKF